MENTPSSDLYNLLVTRDFDPEILDSAGKPVTDPTQAELFSFDWKAQNRNYGTVVVLLGADQELEVYYGDNLGRGMESEDRRDWYRFLEQMKSFATRNLLTFELNNLNRLKYTMQGMAAIREGLFEGYYGRKNISYSDQPKQTRLMIRHNRDLGEGEARFRAIESLFVETADGERFRVPSRSLTHGRLMARHIAEGGTPYDAFGQHITDMMSEMATLQRFVRAARGRSNSAEAEAMIESAVRHYQALKAKAKRMIGQRGYLEARDSFDPGAFTDSEVTVEAIRDMFIESNLDPRIEEALPVLARLDTSDLKETAMKEITEFASWARRLTEGTWAVPDTPEAERRLQELMAQELPVGPDATNATEQLYDLIGDDELYDQLQQLARDDPDADARPLIQARLEELGFDIGIRDQPDADQELGEAVKRHHFIYEVAYDPRYQYTYNPGDPRTASAETQAAWEKIQAQQKKEKQERQKQQSAGSAGKDDFVAPHGDVKQELELFAAGRKPAAIVNEPHFGLWKRLIDSGRYVLRPLTGEGGRQSGLVIGQPDQEDRVSKIQALVQNATDAGLKGDFRAYQNSNYHRWLGRLLGYPAEAIERFVTNYFRDTEDLAKQRVDEQDLLEFTGDEMQYATTPASTAANDPERPVGVLMFGRFGKTDPMARTAWAALQKELPNEYPNEDAAATKVAEIARDGGAIVTEKPRPEAERLIKRFQAYDLKSRIVDDNLKEQNTALGRRMPRIGDTLQWRTMQDKTTRTGTVLDIKGFDVTVKPKRLPGETAYPRPMGVNLANKQLTYRVIPAELSMTRPGGWTPQTPLEADNRGVDNNLGEQNTVSGRRMPKVGDTIEWSTMRDRTPRRGRVIDVGSAYIITVHPENSQRPIKLSLANKSLIFRVIPNPALDTPTPPPAKPSTAPQWSDEFKDIRNAEGETRLEFKDKIKAAGGHLLLISKGPFGPDVYDLNGKEVRWQGVKKPAGHFVYVPPSTQTSAPAAGMGEDLDADGVMMTRPSNMSSESVDHALRRLRNLALGQ